MTSVFVSASKFTHVSVVTEGQREALRLKLDATCVWFSISTCPGRHAAGLMLSVTPNRWASALETTGDGCSSSVGVNVFCKRGG